MNSAVTSIEMVYESEYIGMDWQITAWESQSYPACDATTTTTTCDDGYFFNDLTCDCMVDVNQLTACSADACYADSLYNSPYAACACASEDEIKILFPSWAPWEAIVASIGQADVVIDGGDDDELDFVICPFEDNARVCTAYNTYWDELACQCF